MVDGRIEIIDGKVRRRRWNAAEKLRIVAETHERGVTVRAVAAQQWPHANGSVKQDSK